MGTDVEGVTMTTASVPYPSESISPAEEYTPYREALRMLAARDRGRREERRRRLLDALLPILAFAERHHGAGRLAALALSQEDPDRPCLRMQAEPRHPHLPGEIQVVCEHDSYERREALIVTAGQECMVFFGHEGLPPVLDHLDDLLDRITAARSY